LLGAVYLAMDFQLNGKRAIVTGSTFGIGWAIARELAAEGATVLVNGRRHENVTDAIARIKREVPGANVEGIAEDLSTAGGCANFLARAGDADILVNNLGIFDPKPFEDIPDGDWLRFFETNVMSGVRLARHFLPKMKAKNWGRVIFISSESGICPPAEMVHYGMTKSAQLSVARGLAETCVNTGVTVNAVLPGPTMTEGAQAFLSNLAKQQNKSMDEIETDFFANARPTSILRRFIKPQEVAAMVAYVCSPRSSATNGAALKVEGGVVRSLV
jgi:NAD(P)-dependent dehydrogenase (short-subunit alcohol dehydrogenase family)